MKDKLKRLLEWGPDTRAAAVLSVCALLFLLVPLLRLAFYAIPWYDDYNYGQFVKDFLDEERSIRSAFAGAFYCTGVQWYAWQGTFSSIFFMSLMPAVWGEQYYFWGPVFLILILSFSAWTLTGALVRHVLKGDRAQCIVLQAIATAMIVELIYSAQQGFYWYNGGVHYVGMHSFLLFLAAAWVRLITDSGRSLSVFLVMWSLAGAVLAGGANYVTALQGLLAGVSIAALGALLRKKRAFLLAPSLLLYALCFYRSAAAPGNDVRNQVLRNYGGGGMPPVMAIGSSFKEAVLHLGEFTDPAMLIMLMLAAPFVWNVVKKQPIRFRYPGVLLAWSFCLYAAGFAPTLYAMGHGGFDRTLNAVKITYQFLVIINFAYWTGWLCRKRQETEKPRGFGAFRTVLEKLTGVGQGRIALRFYLLAGILLLTAFALEKNQAGSFSSYGAYYYIHTGEANEFHREYLARVETIKNGSGRVAVDAYYFRPWFLRIGDLSEDADSEQNQAMARWYNREAVYCRSEDTE